MTTLIITSSWPRTGDEMAGTFVRCDALARVEGGERVIVAAPTGKGVPRGLAHPTSMNHRSGSLQVMDVPHAGLFGTPGAMTRMRENPLRAFGLLPFHRGVTRIARECRFDRLVAHWLLPSGCIARAIVGSSAALELIAHGADVRLLERMPRRAAATIIEWLCERAEIFRTVSQGLADRLVRIAPHCRRSIRIAPMPIAIASQADVDRLRREGTILRNMLHPRTLAVVAARLVREKRIDRAIDHLGPRDTLVLLGDGPEKPSLVERADQRGILVHALGARPHDETLAWIAAADVLLAPLEPKEGAPTVIREGRALGTPVIVF